MFLFYVVHYNTLYISCNWTIVLHPQVSAFSTWEKELHKIVFDPRYLLLTSKERKQVFEKYVKERAEEERREKRNKMKERKEQFQKLLEEAGLHGKYVYKNSIFFFIFCDIMCKK